MLRNVVVLVVASELPADVPAEVSCICGVWAEIGCPGVTTVAVLANDGLTITRSDSRFGGCVDDCLVDGERVFLVMPITSQLIGWGPVRCYRLRRVMNLL